MSARDAILSDIRRSLRKAERPAPPEVAGRLSDPRPNPVPARGRLAPPERLELFAAMVRESQAGMTRVATWGEAVAAVARLAPRVAAAPALAGLDWAGAGIEARFGAAGADDQASVTGAFLGIAETGTCMLVSGPDSPTTLNFLPDLHIVLVEAGQVVGTYEEAIAALRRLPALPRTVNWITGPSRTGDIEQILHLGAHGPRRLHVVLVDEPRPHP